MESGIIISQCCFSNSVEFPSAFLTGHEFLMPGRIINFPTGNKIQRYTIFIIFTVDLHIFLDCQGGAKHVFFQFSSSSPLLSLNSMLSLTMVSSLLKMSLVSSSTTVSSSMVSSSSTFNFLIFTKELRARRFLFKEIWSSSYLVSYSSPYFAKEIL